MYWLRQRAPDPIELEKQRRIYLNRVGRIVEGQILDIIDQPHDAKPAAVSGGKAKQEASHHSNNGGGKLLYYTYSISGVTYETAQDISGLAGRAVVDHVIAGQSASVKYDPSNPSNSMLISDDWSGLH